MTTAEAIKFADCIRSHGVPNYPDSTPSNHGEGIVADGLVFPVGPGLNPQSPAFKQAAPACGIRIP